MSRPALCAARQRSRFGVVRPEEEKAAPWNQVDEALKGDADRREIGIDVGVIELDVVDHADVREVLEELRGLVGSALSYSSPSITNSRPPPIR